MKIEQLALEKLEPEVPVFEKTEYGTYTLAYNSMAIHDPTFSECGRFKVEPSFYGFKILTRFKEGSDFGTLWGLDGMLVSGKPVTMVAFVRTVKQETVLAVDDMMLPSNAVEHRVVNSENGFLLHGSNKRHHRHRFA